MRGKIFSFVFAIFVAVASLFCAAPVFADAFNDPVCSDTSIPEETRIAAGCTESKTIWGTAAGILNVAITISGVICVLVIVICGIMLTVSAGDPGKAAKAKKGILYAVIGVVITVLAWAMVNFVLANIT